MTIDWTISIGNIIETAVLLLTLAAAVISFGRRFTMMEKKTNLMFAWFLRSGQSDLSTEEIAKFFDMEPKK